MFERFTAEARQVVVDAQEVARRLDDDRIGSEHVLVALSAAQGPGGDALRRLGLTPEATEESVREHPRGGALDAQALAAVGIDLDAVRERADATFGPGALDAAGDRRGRRPRTAHRPFTPDARKQLELSLREAVRLRHRAIDSGHLVLASTRLDGSGAAAVLRRAGVGTGQVRDAVALAWARAVTGDG